MADAATVDDRLYIAAGSDNALHALPTIRGSARPRLPMAEEMQKLDELPATVLTADAHSVDITEIHRQLRTGRMTSVDAAARQQREEAIRFGF